MNLSAAERQKMFELAQQMLSKAYAPYSNFLVGACIKSGDQYYNGCNIENVSYSLTNCAEAVAIGQMVAANDKKIDAIVIVSSGTLTCAPCGACRQRLAEFSSADTEVYMYDGADQFTMMTLSELLPLSFGPQNLDK